VIATVIAPLAVGISGHPEIATLQIRKAAEPLWPKVGGGLRSTRRNTLQRFCAQGAHQVLFAAP